MRTGKSYLEAEVMSSSPEQLVPMVYRALLKNLRRAVDQIESGDIAGKSESVSKATAIILELAASLDMSQGDISRQLSSLYQYFLTEIEAASRTLDASRFGPTIEMISRLEEAWANAAAEVATAPPQPARARAVAP